MKSKFEQLIEHIINDEEAQARELFHNLVVEKSREIYNELIAEEAEMDDEEEDEEELDEGFDDDSMDQTDDMMGDIDGDEMGMGHDEPMDHDEEGEFGGEEHDENGLEDRVMDLEDALDELESKFQSIMGHEEHGEEDSDEFGDEDDEEEELPEGMVREYTEKVKEFYKGDNSEGAGVGAGSIGGATNAKSIVAGKNDMGGSAKNIAQGGANQDPDGKQYGKPSNAYTKGEGKLKGAGSYENVPGAKAGKAFSNAKKPVTKDGAANDKSIVAKR
jgi:hypothetical protein